MSEVMNVGVINVGQSCNQCDYASSQAINLRTHVKTHSGEKSNKCDQCDFACWLRTHLKTHSGENLNKCPESKCTTTNNHLRQAFYGDIHILGQIIQNWFGEVTPNCWKNYKIFQAILSACDSSQ